MHGASKDGLRSRCGTLILGINSDWICDFAKNIDVCIAFVVEFRWILEGLKIAWASVKGDASCSMVG